MFFQEKQFHFSKFVHFQHRTDDSSPLFRPSAMPHMSTAPSHKRKANKIITDFSNISQNGKNTLFISKSRPIQHSYPLCVPSVIWSHSPENVKAIPLPAQCVCVCVRAVTRGLTQPLNVKKQQALASCNTISTCMRQLGRGCGSLSESTFLVHIISKISTNVLCLLFDKHCVKLCATCFSLFLWSLVSLFLRLLDVALYF